MVFFMFFLILGWFMFFFSSLHALSFLLFIEVLVVSCFFSLVFYMFSWVYPIMFLLFAVCLGAYGISIYISLSRVGGNFSYFLSF